MADVVTLYTALEEFLAKFSESTTSYADYTEFNWTDANGETQKMKIPSIGHMKTDISEVKQQLEELIKNNDDKIVLKYGDDSVRTFEMKKVSALLDNINRISDTSFDVPTEFKAKANWMFESFLNPLLYVGVNVYEFIKDNDVKKFAVRRLILNSPSANDINVFNANLKGVNNLDYDETVTFLRNQGLQYSVDDNEYELAASVNRYVGSFSVLKVEKSTAVIDNKEYPQNYYTLDKMFYTDAINNSKGLTQIAVGDILLTKNDTEYEVMAVDVTNNRVLLKKNFGNDPIEIGVDTLKIKPEAYRIPELQINIGYNEYECIFVKPIANVLDLTTNAWSLGFGMYTNELNILLSSNQSISLPDYYNSYVADFGLMMLNFAKEKQIPASIGIKPDAPVLNASDYKVEQINTHIREDKSYEEFKQKIATKNTLKSQIDTLNKSINDAMKKLNTASTQDEQDKLSTKKTINDYNNEKAGKQSQLSTILDEISSYIKSDTNMSTAPKYKIRGFINIPEPKEDIYGQQTIIQIVYQYRYKSKSGGASNVDNIPYTDAQGNVIQGYFSQWNEHRSDIRKKTYDPESGTYIWVEEDTQDSDKINFNQLDISITKGEIVEIRAKAISEAGYPLNPLESDWSNTIEIEFPDELDVEEEDNILAQRLLIEDALTDFQSELNARGLEVHLSDSVTTGDKYYAHQLENIASGTFTPEGNIINAAEYIKTLVNKITALESAITTDEGHIVVKVVDNNGREYPITNGGIIEIIAGYYKDEAMSPGDIITKNYKIRITNSSGTILELVSMFSPSNTVIDFNIDDSNNYNETKGYGKIPIAIGDTIYSSPQVKSQFIYSRVKPIKNSNPIYYESRYGGANAIRDYSEMTRTAQRCQDGAMFMGVFKNDSTYNATNTNDNRDKYTYYTQRITGSTNSKYYALFDGLHILPSMGEKNDEGAEGIGCNGIATLFCLSDKHPLSSVDKSNFVSGNKNGKDLKVFHSAGFGIADGESLKPVYTYDAGGTYYIYPSEQCEFHNPASNGGDMNSCFDTVDSKLKVLFSPDDKYLIGKYTCGAYLSLNPISYDSITVPGIDRVSGVKLSNLDTIEIPLVFQYRCVDYPFVNHPNGEIGGYNPVEGNNLSNVSYTKIVGFDIYQKLRKGNFYQYDDVFSFDVKITGKYKEDGAK